MPLFLAGADPRRMTHCPACGSPRLQPTEGAIERVAARILVAAPLGPAGKRCLDCSWQVA